MLLSSESGRLAALGLCAIARNVVQVARDNVYWRFCPKLLFMQEPLMDNSSDRQADELKDDEPADQPAEQQVDKAADESSEGIPVSEETHGNRGGEKIGNRSSKEQDMREEAKSISGTQPHHDPRNESPDSGPAPLDRY
jgi:hypothetical protein